MTDSEENTNKYTIAFYNLENLFDTKNDPETLDDGFTETGDLHWTQKRFDKKVLNLGKTISQLGYEETNHPPIIIGVAEIENKYVLEQLVHSEFLKNKNYGFIQYDSPDERGIDTALIYRRDFFEVIHSENFPLLLNNPNGERDYTRDILYVKGKIATSALAYTEPVEGLGNREEIHILVNHWPSRHDGTDTTNYKRILAAERNKEIIKTITTVDANAQIIIMGDFNDNPNNDGPTLLAGTDFYNPMKTLLTKYEGSVTYKNAWNLFDQMFISNNFLDQKTNKLQYDISKIYNVSYLEERNGKYRGNPLRTFFGTKYLGGNSDHFPIYSIFSIKN